MSTTAIAYTRPIDDLGLWAKAFVQASVLSEALLLTLSIAAAWGVSAVIRQAAGRGDNGPSVLFGRRIVDGALFPLLLLALGYVARTVAVQLGPLILFKVAIPVLLSLAIIRVGVKVLQVAIGSAPWVRVLERSISWVAWISVVLWVSGLLPILLAEMDALRWTMGGTTLSLRDLVEGALTAGAVLIVALWVSSAIEARLLRDAVGGELSVRKAISNATRALLLFVGFIVAMTAVGIDLTALSVLGGAVGVGIGLGLQKLAANYVSGFVILAERSMRIGDNVRVDNFEGRITDITSRYTVIRSPAGRESIVPNEILITSRVENLSLADPRVWLSTVVSVSYDSDVDLVRQLLIGAAAAQPRVLKDPAPSAALSAFGADGLEFTVGFWIADPENGQLNVRSDINMAILHALRAHDIEIPYPQRVVHMKKAD